LKREGKEKSPVKKADLPPGVVDLSPVFTGKPLVPAADLEAPRPEDRRQAA
jgi:hypothetical protein